MKRKTVAIVSYLTVLGWIVAFMNYRRGSKSSLAKFHLEQSFGIGILAIAVNIFMAIPIWLDRDFTILLVINNIALVILWMIGLISAYYGVRLPLPLIGFYFKDKFRFIQ